MKKLIVMLIVLTATSAVFAEESESEAFYILFAPNSARLRDVSVEQALANVEVITEVVRILNDNPKYRLLIDGHANAVVNTSREERDSLRPLSQQRAEAAANYIVENFRIDRQRLIISGAGGRYTSSTVGSYNRRVSFYFVTP